MIYKPRPNMVTESNGEFSNSRFTTKYPGWVFTGKFHEVSTQLLDTLLPKVGTQIEREDFDLQLIGLYRKDNKADDYCVIPKKIEEDATEDNKKWYVITQEAKKLFMKGDRLKKDVTFEEVFEFVKSHTKPL
jgi:hypothetical protein